jgi:hypothetical protein
MKRTIEKSTTMEDSMKAKTRSARRLSPFNLIEVTLAIGIVAVGMAGLMALFPIGFNATRDAIGENYSADTADQLLHVMAYYSKMGSSQWIALLGDGTTTGMIKEESAKPSSAPTDPPSSLTPVFGIGNIYDAGASSNGVYYVEAKTGSTVDFAAHAIVWKTAAHDIGSSGALLPWDIAATINVELSWPAGKPYARRTKRYYQLTVFNPNPPATP